MSFRSRPPRACCASTSPCSWSCSPEPTSEGPMVLNYIWIGFFLIALVVGLVRLIFLGDTTVFTSMVTSTFDSAKSGFEIALGLTGVLTLWLGLMKVGEQGGAIGVLATIARPFFHRLFPEVPKDHPAHGSIIMNFAANMLGLDNAATPLGLKAMQELQELNPEKDTATNAQIMFLVLNTSGLTVIPISIMTFRAQLGAANPSDVFIPILLTTYIATLVALIAVAIVQRINLFDPVILAYLVVVTGLVAAALYYFNGLPQERIQAISNVVANVTLFGVISAFIAMALFRRINVYEAFIGGARLRGRRHRAGRHRAGPPHRLHPRAAHRVHEAAQRERGPRHDGGRDEDLRSGFLRRAAGVHLPGSDGHHILHSGALLRLGGRPQDAARRGHRIDRGFRRRHRGHLHRLPVLGLIP